MKGSKYIIIWLKDTWKGGAVLICQALRLRYIKYWVQSGLPHWNLSCLPVANFAPLFPQTKICISPVFIVVRRMGSKIKKQNRARLPDYQTHTASPGMFPRVSEDADLR